MTTPLRTKLATTFRNPRRAALFSILSAAAVAGLTLAACDSGGGGSNLTCGKGTEQKGDQCIVTPVTVGPKTDAGPIPDASAPAGKPDAAPPVVDSGTPIADRISFGGITSASPANQTPPAGSTGTATANAIRLTWSQASYPAYPAASIHYEIYYSASATQNFAVPADDAPPGATSFTVEGLDSTKTYYFAVRAVSDVGTAVDDNAVSLSAKPAFDDTAPTFAGAVSATSASSTSVLVKWKAGTDDQTAAAGLQYRVFWHTATQTVLELGAISDPGATQAEVKGLPAPGTAFQFRVNAVDAAGNIDTNVAEVSGSTAADTTPPVFAGCQTVLSPSASSATVTWVPATDDTTTASAITYDVYASDVPITKDTPLASLQDVGTFTGVDSAGNPVTSGRVTGLSPDTSYNFICRATDAFKNQDKNLVIQTATTTNDGTPPVFAGVSGDTVDSTTIDLTWPQAKDNDSADGAIIYDVYVSLTAGGESYDSPLLVSNPGALGIHIPAESLAKVVPTGTNVSNTDYYVVVRSEDEAGNIDTNTDELKVTTYVSFSLDVQPIFTANCALQGCHSTLGGQSPVQGQNLMAGSAWANIYNVQVVELGTGSTVKRIDGASMVPTDSYLYDKITDCCGHTGSYMPPQASGRPRLSQTQIDTIGNWIMQGAQNN